MTPERLGEIERRANAATAGPWFNDVLTDHVLGTQAPNGESHIVLSGTVDEDDIRDWGEDGKYCTFDTPATKEFVSHARTDVPDLVAEVRRLHSENSELRRLRAAVGHMQQEINTLRSREMDVDDIADYSEDRAKLKAENEQLKLAKMELVEALKVSRQFVDHSPDCICRGCERIETALAKHGVDE